MSEYGEPVPSFREAFYDRCERAIENEDLDECKVVARDVQSTMDNYARLSDYWRTEADENSGTHKTFYMMEAHECLKARDKLAGLLYRLQHVPEKRDEP
jgi:hypothetical protein